MQIGVLRQILLCSLMRFLVAWCSTVLVAISVHCLWWCCGAVRWLLQLPCSTWRPPLYAATGSPVVSGCRVRANCNAAAGSVTCQRRARISTPSVMLERNRDTICTYVIWGVHYNGNMYEYESGLRQAQLLCNVRAAHIGLVEMAGPLLQCRRNYLLTFWNIIASFQCKTDLLFWKCNWVSYLMWKVHLTITVLLGQHITPDFLWTSKHLSNISRGTINLNEYTF